MRLGIDCLMGDSKRLKALKGRRIALLGHPASFSMEKGFLHTADRLAMESDVNLSCLFGPQHGIRGEKQDNMIESEDFIDPKLGIPVFSLYGETRVPTQKMLEKFDVLLVDLQDIGCRIYTYLTTLAYFLQTLDGTDKEIWVLDRPNPVGRRIEGLSLEEGNESFVGCAPIPMRHGLTLGEFASYFVHKHGLDVKLAVVKMEGYDPVTAPGFGWSESLPWVNPSPNIPSLHSARVFPGGVLLEGTVLSEGRGTTRPFEMVGSPDLPVDEVLAEMKKIHPSVVDGCVVRPCFFEPTFQKHAGRLCAGIQIHIDSAFLDMSKFEPYRFFICFLKAVKNVTAKNLWREFHYEYEKERLAFDVICGGDRLRRWIDEFPPHDTSVFQQIAKDRGEWSQERMAFLHYPV